ncbi:MAG: type II/IV secretion system protein [Planctomycetaceae bacterium]|nr:type II/IV secretion system protein [Planctomycetaceae bacterium]
MSVEPKIDFQETSPLIVGDDPEAAVMQIVEEAAALDAGDLFLTSELNLVRVSVRVMGAMRVLHDLRIADGRRCMNFLKTAAEMDLSEKRRPADGRWVYEGPGGRRRDLRINTIPTLHGEDFSIRLLGRDRRGDGFDDLGLEKHQLRELLSILQTPGGLLLVTGPSGAGKTTTLYACLRHLNDGRRKLNTIEDPIECEIPGVRQSQVEQTIGLDFPELLRSVLRQSPDVILIGEIRDKVTAQTAIRAANSGHLVLATMHAPVAAGAVRAMLNYEVHPHFLASSLLGVVSQRLVRVLCQHCRLAVDVSHAPRMFDDVRPWLAPGQGSVIYGPRGCEHCRDGFSAQTGIFELLAITPRLRKLIAEQAADEELTQAAEEAGYTNFRRAGLLKVAQGVTSLEELMRVIPGEYLSA